MNIEMNSLKKNRFKVLSAVLASAALFTGCNNADTGVQGTGAEIPKFNIAAKELPESEGLTFVQNLKVGWNLGNTLDATQKTSVDTASETSWGAPVTTVDMIKAVKNAGFNTLRLPVTWHNHIDKNNTISEDWLKRVKEVVDYGYKNGMYVILDIHHDTDLKYFYPTYEKLEQSKKFVTDIWTQLCEVFKDYDEHLMG